MEQRWPSGASSRRSGLPRRRPQLGRKSASLETESFSSKSVALIDRSVDPVIMRCVLHTSPRLHSASDGIGKTSTEEVEVEAVAPAETGRPNHSY
eukprot:5305177-Heterocapsa_arctica.AAC.1